MPGKEKPGAGTLVGMPSPDQRPQQGELSERPEVKKLMEELSEGTGGDPLFHEPPAAAEPSPMKIEDAENYSDHVVAKPITSKMSTLPNQKKIEIRSRTAETVKVRKDGIAGLDDAIAKEDARRAAKLAGLPADVPSSDAGAPAPVGSPWSTSSHPPPPSAPAALDLPSSLAPAPAFDDDLTAAPKANSPRALVVLGAVTVVAIAAVGVGIAISTPETTAPTHSTPSSGPSAVQPRDTAEPAPSPSAKEDPPAGSTAAAAASASDATTATAAPTKSTGPVAKTTTTAKTAKPPPTSKPASTSTRPSLGTLDD